MVHTAEPSRVTCLCPFSVCAVATFVDNGVPPKEAFCTPSLSLTGWFISRSNLIIHNRCPKYFICAASSLCSSLYFSTPTSLPKFKAALAEILWILNFVYLYCYIRHKNLQLPETNRITCSLEHGRTQQSSPYVYYTETTLTFPWSLTFFILRKLYRDNRNLTYISTLFNTMSL